MGSGTSIGRVRGLGSAKEGAHHWWRQRVTAGSNLFLTLWFVFSLLRLPGYDYASVHDWLRNSWVAVPMILRDSSSASACVPRCAASIKRSTIPNAQVQ